MKIIIVTLFAALVFTITGCEQKTNVSAKAVEENKEVAKKIQEPTPQTASNTVQAIDTPTKKIVEASKTPAAKPASAVPATVAKVTAEEALAETSDRARTITKTQVSAPRQRAQSAEDEMNMELGKHK